MMKNRTAGKHMIDILFPITLFFVLAASALMVIVLAAKIYENTTENSYRNHQSRIALSYISEKIHQSDGEGDIFIDQFEDCDALIFEQTFDDKDYRTYIYYYDGALRELFAKEDVEISLSDGKVILELQEFSMKEAADGLLYFSCTDTENQIADSYVSVSN